VRGYETGHRAGDNLFSTSAELRIPMNSPLNVGRFGFKAFVDAGRSGTRAHGMTMRSSIAGIRRRHLPRPPDRSSWILDIAKPRVGNVRAHFGMGVTF
jgi:hemolysin activation/secretion protein